jgi:hypothetical protein
MSAITIRLANHSDGSALARLAALDGSQPLLGDVTVAEVGGRILAALGSDGHSIADPFERTADLVELLRAHAGAGSTGNGGSRGVLRRLSPAPLRVTA